MAGINITKSSQWQMEKSHGNEELLPTYDYEKIIRAEYALTM